MPVVRSGIRVETGCGGGAGVDAGIVLALIHCYDHLNI